MANAVNRYFEGMLVGGALGVIAGMLLAPKRGSELRAELSESYDDLLKQAGEQWGEISDKMSDKVQPLADRASTYGEKIKTKTLALASKAQSIKGTDGKQLVDNYMGNGSGPMYTPGAKASPTAAGSSMSDACSTYSANQPEAGGG
jgi:gas vesicle protein